MSVHAGCMSRVLVIGAVAVALTGLPTVGTASRLHPEGTLKLADRRLVPGSAVQVRGEKFARGGTLELVLAGLAGRIWLRDVTADSVGGFSTAVEVPADLEIGSYRLVAVAADGDEVATLNVELVAQPVEGPTADEAQREPSVATAEPLVLNRATSPWVTGGAVAGVLVTLVAGGLLIRQPRAAA